MATESQKLLIQRARKASGVQDRPIPKSLRKILFPTSIEVRYRAMLLDFVNAMEALVEEDIVPQIPNYVSESDAIRPKTDSANRFDAWPTQLSNTKDEVNDEANNLQEKPGEQEIQQIATDVSNFNKNQVDLVISDGLGINVFVPEPWLEQEIEAFTQQNLSLIESLQGEYLREVEEAVNRGIQEGDRAEDISQELQKIGDVTESRANLIARDQVGKLHGNLNMLRQENLGVETYTWVTSDDQRVRGDPDGIYPKAKPSHFAKEGLVFRWDSPPPDTGHPGQDYQCRCYAEPNLEEFLEGI
jgi:SPP1 gp7 family putative phage head morphogenesis protein